MTSFQEPIKLVGRCRILAYEASKLIKSPELVVDPDTGLLIPKIKPAYESDWMNNLIVTSGKDLILDRLFSLGAPPGQINSVGVGTDITAPAVTDTKLNPVVAGSVLIIAADGTQSRTNEIVTIQAVFSTAQANFTWGEAGLFNGTVNGTSKMLDRLLVVPPFAKTNLLTVTLQFQITQL